MELRVADVLLDPRQAGGMGLLTYSASENIREGQLGFVPLGPRQVLGVVFKIRIIAPSSLGFEPSLLRPFSSIIEGLSLPWPILSLIEMVAGRTLCSLPEALAPALPPTIQDRIQVIWSLIPGMHTEHSLTPAQAEMLAQLQALPDGLAIPIKTKLERAQKEALRHLKGKGLVQDRLVLAQAEERRKLPSRVRLTTDDARLERFLANEAHRKPAQAFALSQLQSLGQGVIASDDIPALGEITETTIRALIQSGLLESASEDSMFAMAARPNAEQAFAIGALSDAIQARRPDRFLLQGVTGSGKTEVYLQAASEALRMGRKVLYLVPEIALTAQVIGQLRSRFGETVSVLHSNMTPSRRLESWTRIRSGQSAVVVGPRSALFAPIDDLGFIVVDEEHEGSYKQESTPRYHSHALVEHLSEVHRCPVVFGSATPSCESTFAAETGRLKLLELTERAVPDARLPEVFIEDLKELYASKSPSLFTERLHEAIQSTLDEGRQVILFLNRRAYAPGITCRDCGNVIRCPFCAVAMSLHRQERILKCHHCDHQTEVPDACPTCFGARVAPFGVGVEKVEESVTSTFLGARVGRLDRDVTKRKGALEQILSRFRSGELNVLVGTQMVAKGFDFPNVTLVGVIAADISLAVPEFRASERTYQLLSQVSGRAGRASHPGQVIIQTLMPENPSILYAATHNARGFYEATREERQFAGYPPFRRLINITFSGEDRAQVRRVTQRAAEALRKALPSAELLGPTDCAIERLASNWRRHIVIKLHPDAEYGAIPGALATAQAEDVRVVVDVDPQSMM